MSYKRISPETHNAILHVLNAHGSSYAGHEDGITWQEACSRIEDLIRSERTAAWKRGAEWMKDRIYVLLMDRLRTGAAFTLSDIVENANAIPEDEP